jgi:hypothetical protein
LLLLVVVVVVVVVFLLLHLCATVVNIVALEILMR